MAFIRSSKVLSLKKVRKNVFNHSVGSLWQQGNSSSNFVKFEFFGKIFIENIKKEHIL